MFEFFGIPCYGSLHEILEENFSLSHTSHSIHDFPSSQSKYFIPALFSLCLQSSGFAYALLLKIYVISILVLCNSTIL